MSIAALNRLFDQQLRELYSATCEYRNILTKLTTAAQHECLRTTFLEQSSRTASQLQVLKEIGRQRHVNLAGKQSFAMNGLIEDAMFSLEFDTAPSVIDVALIDAARRMLHYQIAVIESAHANAIHLSENEIVSSLVGCLESAGESLETLSYQINDVVLADVCPATSSELTIHQPDGESSGILVWDCNTEMPRLRASRDLISTSE